MPFKIVRSNMEQMHVDAIVYHSDLASQTSDAKIHPSFSYYPYANYNIPLMIPQQALRDTKILAQCYRNLLETAESAECESIALPCPPADPQNMFKEVLIHECRAFLASHDCTIYLVVEEQQPFQLSNEIMHPLSQYLDMYGFSKCSEPSDASYVPPKHETSFFISFSSEPPQIQPSPAFEMLTDEQPDTPRMDEQEDMEAKEKASARPNMIFPSIRLMENAPSKLFSSKKRASKADARMCENCAPECEAAAQTIEPQEALENIFQGMDESFSESLLHLIDITGKKDSEIYKKANVDRKLFSKIRNNKYYQPSKITALAFAFALELTLDETKRLIGKAGFILSDSIKFDVIISYFLNNRKYDLFEVNEVLFAFDQPLIGD